MLLSEHTIKSFADVLASDAPAPGGGSAASLEGALGAALGAMVCALTQGKKKYAEHAEFTAAEGKKLEELKNKYVEMIDKDTEAFNGVSAVFAMPKDTDEQKQARSAAMQEALKACTKTPFTMMEYAVESLRIVRGLVGKSNDSAASDLGCAALSLKAAVQGAWLNVCINIAGIKDEEFVNKYRTEGQTILDECAKLADGIYEDVLKSL